MKYVRLFRRNSADTTVIYTAMFRPASKLVNSSCSPRYQKIFGHLITNYASKTGAVYRQGVQLYNTGTHVSGISCFCVNICYPVACLYLQRGTRFFHTSAVAHHFAPAEASHLLAEILSPWIPSVIFHITPKGKLFIRFEFVHQTPLLHFIQVCNRSATF